MKNLAVFVMLIIGVISAQAQWKVTPEAGVNVTKYKNEVAKMGFKAGAAVSYTFGAGGFSLQSGLYYVQRGKGLSSNREIYGTSEDLDGSRVPSSIYLFSVAGNYGDYGYMGPNVGEYGLKNFEVEGIRSYSEKEHRGYLQIPILAGFNWLVGEDVRLHLAVGPYLAVGLGGKTVFEESDYSFIGKPPYAREASYNPFGSGYSAAPRLDWGATLEVGMEVKRFVVKMGYDLGLGKRYKYDEIGPNYQTASLTIGYTF